MDVLDVRGARARARRTRLRHLRSASIAPSRCDACEPLDAMATRRQTSAGSESKPSTRPVAAPSSTSVDSFRSIAWSGSVPLSIALDPSELPSGADRSIECFYVRRPCSPEALLSPGPQVQAPRVSYLPLLLPTIRKHLIELCLDESSAAALTDDSLWFEAADEAWRWSVHALRGPDLTMQALADRPALRLPQRSARRAASGQGVDARQAARGAAPPDAAPALAAGRSAADRSGARRLPRQLYEHGQGGRLCALGEHAARHGVAQGGSGRALGERRRACAFGTS